MTLPSFSKDFPLEEKVLSETVKMRIHTNIKPSFILGNLRLKNKQIASILEKKVSGRQIQDYQREFVIFQQMLPSLNFRRQIKDDQIQEFTSVFQKKVRGLGIFKRTPHISASDLHFHFFVHPYLLKKVPN